MNYRTLTIFTLGLVVVIVALSCKIRFEESSVKATPTSYSSFKKVGILYDIKDDEWRFGWFDDRGDVNFFGGFYPGPQTFVPMDYDVMVKLDQLLSSAKASPGFYLKQYYFTCEKGVYKKTNLVENGAGTVRFYGMYFLNDCKEGKWIPEKN